MNPGCDSVGGPGSCYSIQIIQSALKVFFVRLFYSRTGEPFDLTNVSEVVALFPGNNNTQVKKTKSAGGGITVVGAPGAGKIQINLTSLDTQNMQANPQVNQNLQIITTISGVAQISTVSFEAPPVSGTLYTVAINGTPFSYRAKTADTAFDVFTALTALIAVGDLPVNPSVTGSLDTANLVLTSAVPALGFSATAAPGMDVSPTIANSGGRTVFLLQQALNIQPQDYLGD